MQKPFGEYIDELQGYLAKVGVFLTQIKFRAAEYGEQVKISETVENYLDGFFNRRPSPANEDLQLNSDVLLETGFAYFKDKEIEAMPKMIKRLIILQQKRCRLYTHACGKNSYTYEIRFRRGGYNVSACGKTIELAKENFLNKIKSAKPRSDQDKHSKIPATFAAFSQFYFTAFRREQVSEKTFKADLNRYKNHIEPYFKEKPLNKITPFDCKTILDGVRLRGLGKTADELFSIMNCIFKSAIAHGVMTLNPLVTVLHVSHETESGTALTREEERILKESGSQYLAVFMLALYTGARPNELPTVRIDGDFIVMVNSKRKNKKVKYKKIPIARALRPYVANGIDVPAYEQLRLEFKNILPAHKLYDLRTTFHTRCIEYKVDEIARKLFMGHSLGELTAAYTDLPDDFLLSEGKKLDEW